MYMLKLSDYIITENGEVINKRNNKSVKPQKNGKGYYRVSIGGKLRFVHRLVAEQYVPNPEGKPQVNHKDGNKSNNHYTNLEWVTNKENRYHAIDCGMHRVGSGCSYSKLTENDVIFIRNNTHLGIINLAEKYHVSRNTISDIIHNRTWKQLKRYAELPQNEAVEAEDKKPLR